MKEAIKRLLGQTALFERATTSLRHTRLSYSQFGEDLHIRSYYDRLHHDRGIQVSTGLFVDIGAFRPIALSNSYAFYRKGWRCINVEPTPGMKRLFDRVRPGDVNLEIAIGKEDGEQTFYCFGSPSVWNTLDPEAAAHAKKMTGILPEERKVTTARLESILQRYMTDVPFEVLSIDAEGLDIEILETHNFEKVSPRFIMIEANGFDPGRISDNEIVNYLKSKGYTLFSWINPNLGFARNDSLPI